MYCKVYCSYLSTVYISLTMMFVFSTIQISVRSTGCGCMWTLPGAVVFSCPPDTAPPASEASRGMYRHRPVVFVCRGIERYVSTHGQSSLSAGASKGMYQHKPVVFVCRGIERYVSTHGQSSLSADQHPVLGVTSGTLLFRCSVKKSCFW